jgi:hypothetical protein
MVVEGSYLSIGEQLVKSGIRGHEQRVIQEWPYVQHPVVLIPGSPLMEQPAFALLVVDDHDIAIGEAGNYMVLVQPSNAPDALDRQPGEVSDGVKAKIGQIEDAVAVCGYPVAIFPVLRNGSAETFAEVGMNGHVA